MRYFTIEELCWSEKASALKVPNVPNEEQRDSLVSLVENVLDPLRAKIGSAIRISSGFRCEQLNKIVGGASKSQHLLGEAADIIGKKPKDTLKLFELAKDMDFDQLIWEKQVKMPDGTLVPKWVHISYKRNGNNRKQILKTLDGKIYTVI